MSKLHCSVCGTELLPHEVDEHCLCDYDLGRSVRQSPVRPARTAGPPSGATVALLVVGAVLFAVAALLPQGAGPAGENVAATWCGVVGLVCVVAGMGRWWETR